MQRMNVLDYNIQAHSESFLEAKIKSKNLLRMINLYYIWVDISAY